MKKRVLIGLSGGVDSAVAAYLLIQQGYDVTGCFMRNWDALTNNDYLGNPTINNDQCPQEVDYEDAKNVAEILQIPFLRVDFVKEYWDHVFSYFLSEYKLGRTPNPDVFCNKYIKFDSFKKFAEQNNFDYIAMGHYAKKVNIDGLDFLVKCKDQNKDQSYFLSQLNHEQLGSCIFPLSDINKEEVREIAKKIGLVSVQDKKDSTGVCFIGERKFKLFLQNYVPASKGNIIDIETNKIIGTHEGVYFYTIGQRKGLGIGGINGMPSNGWFVVKKDVKENILYVSSGEETDYLYSNRCIVDNSNVLKQFESLEVGVKFRYRQKDHPAVIKKISSNKIEVIYEDFKAVTSGQVAVFYEGDVLVASGIILEVYKDDKRIDI